MLSDVTICSEDTWMEVPHANGGLVPGDGMGLMAQHYFGTKRGNYYMMTARQFTAKDMLDFGMVSEVVPKGKAVERAWEIARMWKTMSYENRTIMSNLAKRPLKKLLVEDLKLHTVSEQYGSLLRIAAGELGDENSAQQDEKYISRVNDWRYAMKSKVTTREEIIARFKDGQIIAIGGQTGRSMPERLIDCILESGARHLTVYSIDTSDPGVGIGRLISAGVIDRLITTHVGTNPDTNAQIQAGKIQVEFSPIGSFIERIRCGGMGLGGVLTKTGLGTVVEEGKQVIEANGERYLLETALRADIAITRARRADPIGNLAFRGSTGRASHPVIATCGDLSIVECDHFCDLGEITPDEVEVPGMFVDMILA